MEPIKITFLGTAGSIPQKDKNFASIVLSYKGEKLLFDCPEGNQRQLMQSEHSLMAINTVLISHMHADHFLGLFGWIATMTLNQRKEKLTIYSPKGGKEKIVKIMKEVIYPNFPIEFKELKKGTIIKNELFELSAFPLKHEIPCFGFSYKEANKIGEFNRAKAEKLGIPPGPLYSKLVNGEKIKVQGTYEKRFAKILNIIDKEWIKIYPPNDEFNLKWIDENNITHTYFPDFWCPNLKKFYEVKGWYKDYDKMKMKYILSHYNNVEMIFLKDIKEYENLYFI